MRVVAVLPRYPPHPRVGAFLATHELLAVLVGRGHRVDVFTRAADLPSYTLDGVTVCPGGDLRAVGAAVASADLVVSHAGDDGSAARAAADAGCRSLVMVHGWHDDLVARLASADLVVFNSRSSAAEADLLSYQVVVRPRVRPDVAATPGDRVTLVNLSEPKGGELLWRLARNALDVQFLAVKGGWGRQVIDRAPNVEVLEPTERMADVYSRTRVLLMPSERETWGMTGVEAMSCGIPVIAQPTAGLRESLGDAGIFVDRADAQRWLDQIERLGDDGEWSRASQRALARFAELDLEADVRVWIDAVEQLVPVAA